MKKIYGYARVSTKEQHTDRQMEALKQCGIEERDIIVDKISGKHLDRPGYQSLKGQLLRSGDTLIVKSLDRLSRNKNDIKQELEAFRKQGIRVKIMVLPTTMIDLPGDQDWVVDMVNNILIEVLSSIAEQERLTIRKRQQEGITAAKAQGKPLGRPPAAFPTEWKTVYHRWKEQTITAKSAMEELNLKRTTFYKLVKQYEAEGETLTAERGDS